MAKGYILSLLLDVSKSVIEEALELAVRSYELYDELQSVIQSIGYLFASYIHRQLYAWLACLIENRFNVSRELNDI